MSSSDDEDKGMLKHKHDVERKLLQKEQAKTLVPLTKKGTEAQRAAAQAKIEQQLTAMQEKHDKDLADLAAGVYCKVQKDTKAAAAAPAPAPASAAPTEEEEKNQDGSAMSRRERIDLDKKQKESVKKEQKTRKREEIQVQQQAEREREEAAAEARRLVALERRLLELPRSQSLTCVEPSCGRVFEYTVADQAWYREHHMRDPKRFEARIKPFVASRNMV